MTDFSEYLPIDAPLHDAPNDAQPSRDEVGQFVSLRIVLAALGRRRRFWMLLATAGLIAGMAVATVLPKKYTATATLVMVHNPNDDPNLDMDTDVALLDSAATAQQVISRLGLHLTAAKLMGQYQGLALTDAVLQVTMTGPTPQDVIQRTNALVESFLSVRTSVFQKQNLAVVQGLQDQIASRQQQEASLEGQIAASAHGSTSPLAAVLDEDVTQVAQLQQTIASDNLIVEQIVKGTQVLVNATLVTHSPAKRLVADGASGLVAGLALGIGAVATQTIVSDRVRRRDEFAVALDAPVALSVGKIRRARWMRVRRLRHRLKRPSFSVRRLARHVQSELAVQGDQTLAVVSLDSIEASVLVVAQSASRLAAEGQQVIVVDLSSGALLGRVLKIRRPGAHEAHIGRSSILIVVPPDDELTAGTTNVEVSRASLGLTGTPQAAQAVLVLAELDLSVGAHRLGDWVTEAVVVVTAGRSGVIKVKANAQMLRVAGVNIASAMLVAADRNDETVGDAGDKPRRVIAGRPFVDGAQEPVNVRSTL